jgi:uncharacterized repeat protein (TIGR01451 family)
LLEAARPANDAFINRVALSGNSASASGTSLLATKETGEPNHAGNAGGHSVWWKWTATSAGQLSVNTHGSGFDTLLAAYTGTGVSALTPIASNDNDGTSGGASSILLQVQPGTEYELAVDGSNGVAGNAILNLSLNTNAAASLSVNITGSPTDTVGTASPYTITITNAGPQTATNVVVTVTLPAGSSLVLTPAGCTANVTTLTCSVGTIVNGGSVQLPLQLMWNTGVTVGTISAVVASDLPNPAPSGSTSKLQIAVSNGNDNSDVPTLPEWGLIMLAMLLMGTAARVQR